MKGQCEQLGALSGVVSYCHLLKENTWPLPWHLPYFNEVVNSSNAFMSAEISVAFICSIRNDSLLIFGKVALQVWTE